MATNLHYNGDNEKFSFMRGGRWKSVCWPSLFGKGTWTPTPALARIDQVYRRLAPPLFFWVFCLPIKNT